MNGRLREKNGKWYAYFYWGYNGTDKGERMVSLGLRTKDHTKWKALKALNTLSLSFDPSNVAATNRGLAAMGLPQYSNEWKPIRQKAKRKPKPIAKGSIVIGDAEAAEVSSSLTGGLPVFFGDYLKWWLERVRPTLSPVTQASYEMSIYHCIAPYFNEHKIYLQSITPEDIEEFYRYRMEEKGNKGTTCIHFHVNIREALQFAFRKRFVINNISDRVEKPRKERFVGNFYNQEELEKLFAAIKGSELEVPVTLAAYYGLRREEALGLRWDAVDFLDDTLSVRHTASEVLIKGERKLILRDTTKTKSSWRTLPLFPSIKEFLTDVHTKQEGNRKLFGNRYNHGFDMYICVFENGDLMTPDWLSKQFPRFLKDHGLRKIRFHDLQHSCATLMRRQGVPMEDIQKWLGHSTISTTEGIYAHYDDSQSIGTMKKIAVALDGCNDKDGGELG